MFSTLFPTILVISINPSGHTVKHEIKKTCKCSVLMFMNCANVKRESPHANTYHQSFPHEHALELRCSLPVRTL